MPNPKMPWLRDKWRQLQRDWEQQRFAHAHCFVQQPGLGSAVLLEQLCQLLLCSNSRQRACGSCKSCLLYKAGTHPDYLVIRSEDGKAIGVDSIRRLIVAQQTKAHQSGSKVVRVEDADRMTTEAANALLKTLEEPQPDTYILVAAERPSLLLPTLLSRLQRHQLTSLTEAQIGQWLEQELGRSLSAEEAAQISFYRDQPLTLLNRINQPESNSAATIPSLSEATATLAEAWLGHGPWPSPSKTDVELWLQASEYVLMELIRSTRGVAEPTTAVAQLHEQLKQANWDSETLQRQLQACYALRRQLLEQSGLNHSLLLENLWSAWRAR
ncbi:DNA polymerase III subunit delta' C-terminal domain-containing protein [Pseudidiomarina taiwanensis]|nr:DNA polymerase III subunit delta' C-terminal domain-containing protein [Pseudidiomarina taiwanensis]